MKRNLLLLFGFGLCLQSSLYAENSITIEKWQQVPEHALVEGMEIIKLQENNPSEKTVYVVEEDILFGQKHIDEPRKYPERVITLAKKNSITWMGRDVIKIQINDTQLIDSSLRIFYGYEYYPSFRWPALALITAACVVVSIK